MGNPVHSIVTAFKGMSYASRQAEGRVFTERRRLDTPRVVENMLVTDEGHLWMPKAGSTYLTVTGATAVKKIVPFTGIRNTTMIQDDTGDVFMVDNTASPSLPAALFTLADATQDTWLLAYDSAAYVGNESETWKVTYSGGYAADEKDSGAPGWGTNVPNGFQSMQYRGRRFVIDRTEQVWYSDNGDPETFGVNSVFLVGGDEEGDSWFNNAGSVVACIAFQEVLLIFLTQSVHVFTGTDPDTNFQRRDSGNFHGVWSRDSITQTPQGILYFGGTPMQEPGVYLFTGSNSRNVGFPIQGVFRDWMDDDMAGAPGFADATNWQAVRWNDLYIFAAYGIAPGSNDWQIYVLNMNSMTWSVFTGFDTPTVSMTRYVNATDRLLISNGNVITETTDKMMRLSGENGRVVLGYHDENRPTGLIRFMGLKISGWKAGTGNPTVSGTVTTSEGDTATLNATNLTDDVFDGVLLPIDLRGHAIEIDLTITPANDDNEVTIESIDLVMSRKGEKVSRV